MVELRTSPVTTSATAAPKNAVAILHIVVMLLASAALVLSGVYGWLHLVQYRQMRRRAFGRLFRNLPSLELLSATTRRAALAGFVCLTIGLNVGIGLGHATPETAFRYTDPEVVLVMALWIHFGVIAFSGGFHGRTMMAMALTGKVVPYKTGFGPFPGDVYHLPFPIAYHGVTVEESLEASVIVWAAPACAVFASVTPRYSNRVKVSVTGAMPACVIRRAHCSSAAPAVIVVSSSSRIA